MSAIIEALYIYNPHNVGILQHIYRSRPPHSNVLLRAYLSHPSPRPPLLHLSNLSPPVIVLSVLHSNLLFLATTTFDSDPLVVLEFLHRIVDALEEFLGAPLLETKIENGYDIVAQLLAEMCDAGQINTTESNALRDLVEVPGWMGKLLGGVGLPGSSLATPSLIPQPSSSSSSSIMNPPPPQLPWRRANVRHTSNELYVDIIESLNVIIAPSGRPLSAFAQGSIVFTSKISGIPDLLLVLTSSSSSSSSSSGGGGGGGGKSNSNNIDHILELPVFHPCVRLSRWRERPGELSFVPPDGRFILAGYEVDLLPSSSSSSSSSSWTTMGMQKLPLPISVDVKKNLGPNQDQFEIRLCLSNNFPGISSSSSSSFNGSSRSSVGMGMGIGGRSTAGGVGGLGARFTGGVGVGVGTQQQPTFENLVISIPIPSENIRTITDLYCSRGDASYLPQEGVIEWRIPTNGVSAVGSGGISGILKGTVIAMTPPDDNENDEEEDTTTCDYNEGDIPPEKELNKKKREKENENENGRRGEKMGKGIPMPSSIQLSFSIKGWLASGLKIDSLNIQHRSSRGLGEGVRPYKGVKYLTVAERGWEIRC